MNVVVTLLAFVVVFVVLFFAVFRFTFMKEGTAKIVLKLGAFDKVLLAKTRYAMDADWNIGPGEQELGIFKWLGGLRFVGIRFIHTIHKRDLKWVKSLPDGIFEDRSEPDVDFILAAVDYQYGLRIKKAESKDLLNLDAEITLTARIINPYRAQFAVKDWFAALVGRIAPAVREYISNHTYEEIISDPNVQLDRDVMKELRLPASDGSDSIIGKLREFYGIEVFALETVNIDPPEEYRKATLTKWQAERQADAARSIAKKEAEETEGRIIEAVAKANGMSRDELEDILRASPEIKGLPASEGGLKEDFTHARDVLKRDRAGDGLEDIRVGNVDGTPLEPGIATIAAMFGLAKRKGNRHSGGKSVSDFSEKKGESRRKKSKDMSADELEDEWDKDQKE